MRKRLSVLVLVLTSVPLCVTISLAESTGSMLPKWYVAEQLADYGPHDCGNTHLAFRLEVKREIADKLAAQARTALMVTPDGRPYPYEQIYIEDLLNLRDLFRINDPNPEMKVAWDEEIRYAATAAYERIKQEGLLK